MPPEFQIRGGDEGAVQVLTVGDMEGTVSQLRQLFDQARVSYQVFPLGLKVGVEAQLPVPVPDDLSAKLRSLGISPPENGTLVLEVQPRE